MNRLALYVFPLGVVIGGPFWPLAFSSTGSPTTCGLSAGSTTFSADRQARSPARAGTDDLMRRLAEAPHRGDAAYPDQV
jgi:hypothetical protein